MRLRAVVVESYGRLLLSKGFVSFLEVPLFKHELGEESLKRLIAMVPKVFVLRVHNTVKSGATVTQRLNVVVLRDLLLGLGATMPETSGRG